MKQVLKTIILFVLALFGFYLLFNVLVPHSDSRVTKQDFLKEAKLLKEYVAIGDSLTQGVGDTTDKGGFVPLLAKKLDDEYSVVVESTNYGVAGNTSNQILKRMKETEEIQTALASADIMTLTVGGNDVMSVLKKNITNLSIQTFSKAESSYQERVRQIIDLARTDNPELTIYILGIYNPFYLNFPDMDEMQTIVDNWNNATAAVTEEYDGVYFVPINDLLYKGIDGEEGVVTTTGDDTTVINDALFEDDHFHPNNTGYRIMANAVMEKISETEFKW